MCRASSLLLNFGGVALLYFYNFIQHLKFIAVIIIGYSFFIKSLKNKHIEIRRLCYISGTQFPLQGAEGVYGTGS